MQIPTGKTDMLKKKGGAMIAGVWNGTLSYPNLGALVEAENVMLDILSADENGAVTAVFYMEAQRTALCEKPAAEWEAASLEGTWVRLPDGGGTYTIQLLLEGTDARGTALGLILRTKRGMDLQGEFFYKKMQHRRAKLHFRRETDRKM